MRRACIIVLSLSVALPLGACFQHTYIIGAGASSDAEPVYKHWHHHWVFGLIRPKHQKELNLEELCASGNATIHEEVTFVNGLIDVLIGFIYSPTTVTITCEDGTSKEVELDQEDVASIVTDPRFASLVRELVPERLAEVEAALTVAGERSRFDRHPAR